MNQPEASQVLSLGTVLGIVEDEVAERDESQTGRYRAPDAVRGEPLPERAPLIEAPVEVKIHAADRRTPAAVRERQKIERDFLGEEPGENPAAEVLMRAGSRDAVGPVPDEEKVGSRPDENPKQQDSKIEAQQRRG